MFDARIRPYIDPSLNKIAKTLYKMGARADHVTWAGLALGALACVCVVFQLYMAGLFFLLLNRAFDGLDGPLARLDKKGPSHIGAFIDIVFDFLIYAGLPFCMAAGLGTKSAWVATAFLLFGIILSGSSFLAYAILAAKDGRQTSAQGKKGFFYVSGLMEGAETILFLVLICLAPQFYVGLAVIFGLLCFMTGAGRIGRALMDYA